MMKVVNILRARCWWLRERYIYTFHVFYDMTSFVSQAFILKGLFPTWVKDPIQVEVLCWGFDKREMCYRLERIFLWICMHCSLEFHVWLSPYHLQEAESNRLCRRLQLKDIIPAEMQRFTKYPLLMDNIAKYTGIVLLLHAHTCQRDKIKMLPSCHSKPVETFFFGTQNKILWEMSWWFNVHAMKVNIFFLNIVFCAFW